jgi:hypothetical protein
MDEAPTQTQFAVGCLGLKRKRLRVLRHGRQRRSVSKSFAEIDKSIADF